MSIYQKVCSKIGKLLPLSIKDEKLKEYLEFCGIEVEPKEVYNTSFLILFIFLIISIPFFILKNQIVGMAILIGGALLSAYIIFHPRLLSKYIRVTETTNLLLTVLYMIISLRIVPNLENAIKFAASNVKGNVGKQLRKLMHDIYIGKYPNADKALEEFSSIWKVENQEFYDAIETIRAAMMKTESERLKIFEEIISTLLERNTERMKIYAQEMKTSITIITYMGIVLPILVTAILPILTGFMKVNVNPFYFVFLYNILIPLTILIFNFTYLRSFPTFLSEIEYGKIEGSSKIGWLKVSKINIPILPISILVGFLLSFFGYNLIVKSETNFLKLIGAEIIVYGVIISIVLYSFLSYYQNSKIREKIVSIEGELPVALYNLGNILSLGYSLEGVLDKLLNKIKNLKIAELFRIILSNVRKGFNFQKAIFDKDFGAIKYFKSSLLENTLRIISEGARMGSLAVSQSIITISNYLREVKKIELFSAEIFDEITSELRILNLLLIPLFIGIITGISGIMGDIMNFLQNYLASIVQQQNTTVPGFVPSFGFDFKAVMKIEHFTLVFGIYMVEITIISTLYLSTIEGGKDKLKLYEYLARFLIVQLVLYAITSIALYGFVSNILPFKELI